MIRGCHEEKNVQIQQFIFTIEYYMASMYTVYMLMNKLIHIHWESKIFFITNTKFGCIISSERKNIFINFYLILFKLLI